MCNCICWSFLGVYGTMEFKEGDLIMKDKILVGIQHVPNKVLHSSKITLYMFFFCDTLWFFFLFNSKIANLHFFWCFWLTAWLSGVWQLFPIYWVSWVSDWEETLFAKSRRAQLQWMWWGYGFFTFWKIDFILFIGWKDGYYIEKVMKF